MIWFVAFVVLALLAWYSSYTEKVAVEARNRIIALEYKILEPSIREYARLKGLPFGKFPYEPKVEFGCKYLGDKVEVLTFEEIEPALVRLKSTIERNCPKKCTKPKTKK